MLLKNNKPKRYWLGIASLTAALVWMTTSSATVHADRNVRLDAGMVIPVRLNDNLSTLDSEKGDTFSATVRKTEDSEDYLGLPEGTRIEGVVRNVKPQSGKDPGILDLSFQRMKLPDGRSFAVEGALIGLDNKSVVHKSDGTLIARPEHKTDRLTYVGYGAGAGLILGLLTKRPLETTLLGGGLGYLFSSLQKGNSRPRDVVLKPGTEMGVRLDRSMLVKVRDDDLEEVGNRDQRIPDDYDFNTVPVKDDRIEIGVMFDDQEVPFASDTRPVIINDVILVPLFPVLKASHQPYTYNTALSMVTIRSDEGTVRFNLGSRIMVINGDKRVRLEAPVQKLNGTVYVPIKALEPATGQEVQYDSSTRTVILQTKERP